MTLERLSTRSSSSSALLAKPTVAHNRRPSRLPLSLSTAALARDASAQSSHVTFAVPPSPIPPIASAPSFVARLGAQLDALLARRRRKRRRLDLPVALDLRVALALVAAFLVLFALLFLLLTRSLGRASRAPPPPDNLRRVADHLAPHQFWPDPSRARSRPPPVSLLSDASDADIRAWRRQGPAPFFAWFARPLTPVTPRITLVAACATRTAFLQTALPGWLRALPPDADLLLVDWGTQPPHHVPLSEVVRAANDHRISVVSVQRPGPWVLSRAYNLAFRLARGQWILKLDCDTMLTLDFFNQHPLLHHDSRSYYRFQWHRARDDNEQHLNGVFMAPADAIRQISGYDERITTYGWDDDDLYTRLGHLLTPLEFNLGTLSHIPHGDDLRGASQHLVMGPTLETQLNSHASAALPSWTTVGAAQRTAFRIDILSRDARFLAATIRHAPTPLMEQLSVAHKHTVVKLATDTLLHDIYGFPWSVLAEINRSRAELVRSLAILGRSTHWQSGNGFIFAEVGGTVPERVLGMASAVSLARTYERPLFVAWSSGSREDPTPRITDFFDVDGSDMLDQGTENSAARIYQVGRWRCRSAVAVCARRDAAFNMMTEFRSGGHEDDQAAAQAIVDVLEGKTHGKRNVLLRLEGAFPKQTQQDLEAALTSLKASTALREHISQLGDMSEQFGVYIGRGLRAKGVDAMLRRLEDHAGAHRTYFVSGASREMVQVARKTLPETDAVRAVADITASGSTAEIRETVRDIAELFALASCQSMVHDGRVPDAVLRLTTILKRRRDWI